MKRNIVKVRWQFDIETNEELWSRLNLTEGEVREMLEDEEDTVRLYRLCCGETGASEYVDLDLLFDDPRDVSEDEITETLSDEFGWLLDGWEWQDV